MKAMLKLILILSGLYLTACAGSNSSPQSPTDPLLGDWQFTGPEDQNGTSFIAGLKLDGQNIKAITAEANCTGQNCTVVYHKNLGTYSKTGNTLTVIYSYETCNPVQTEQFQVQVDPNNSNRLIVQQGTVSVTMERITSQSSAQVIGIEDTQCSF